MEAITNKNLLVSGAHSLRVIPCGKIFSMGVVQGEAHLLTFDSGIELKAVPGSVQPTDTADDDLVAIYVDEQGRNKVGGSLDWPMRFTFSITGGLYECQLECRGLDPMPYLAD